jgi:hypothetical protein
VEYSVLRNAHLRATLAYVRPGIPSHHRRYLPMVTWTLLVATLLSQTMDKEYFPMKQGTRWVYVEGKDERTIEVAGVMTIAGQECSVLSLDATSKYPFHYAYRVGDEGVLLSAEKNKLLEAAGKKDWVESKPPELELKLGTKKGDTWERKLTSFAGTKYENYEHAGEEEVTVPAGSFKAVKIVLSSHLETSTGKIMWETRTTKWYARGVGLIKREVKQKDKDAPYIRELKSYTAGK